MIEEMHEIMGALECGVAPRSGGVDKWLQSLPPEDSRRARRKWRKIWRREMKLQATGDRWGSERWTAEYKKHVAKRDGWYHVLREGRKVFAEKD